MPSVSYQHWRTTRRAALDDIETAHAGIGGTGRARQLATQQVNRAYVVILSAEFQGFCRDLHTECIDRISRAVPAPLQPVLDREFRFNRSLDRGNPNPASIGSDFGRFGFDFWPEVLGLDSHASDYRTNLETLNTWRNAIAHNDFAPTRFTTTILLVSQVREWRRSCNQLSHLFDTLLQRELTRLTGTAPW
jgi:hypothetical protein